MNVEPLAPPLTGIGRYTLELLRGLLNHEAVTSVHCFSGFRFLPDPHKLLEPNGNGEFYKSLKVIPGAHTIKNRIRNYLFHKRVTRFKGSVYHEPSYVFKPYDGPKVVTVHDVSHVRNPEWHPVERVRYLERHLESALNEADRIITVSRFSCEEIHRVFGVDKSKIRVTPLGVGKVFYPRSPQSLALLKDRFGLAPGHYVLYVGTVEPRKNLETLIEGYLKLPQGLRCRYPLVVAGPRGWKSERLEERLEVLHRKGEVRRIYYLNENDLGVLYAGATLFVYISFYEGFGLPPLEAMASGVPVVVSRAKALMEVVEDAGLIVDPYDTDATTCALEKALTDKLWRREAVVRGIERANLFKWWYCIDRSVEVYLEVIRERGFCES